MKSKKLLWFRLDNSAKMYPLISTRFTQSLFRVSIYLKENVDPEILQEALKQIMPYYPSFNVRLRKGLFWNFLEENTKHPLIFKDDGIVLKKINDKKNNNFMFKVLYYNSRISIEYFHAMTDGLGGSEFLKALTLRYFLIKENNISAFKQIFDENHSHETEDSFLKNYKKKNLKEFIHGMKYVKGEKAHQLTGNFYDLPGYAIYEGILNSKQLLAKAREKGITITTYVGAYFLLSCYKNRNKNKKFKPMTIFIPINLRGYFKSKTIRNFVSFTRAGIREKTKDELTFEDFAAAIDKDLKNDLSYDILQDRLSNMVYIEKMPIMRIVPLPVKALIFKISKLFAHTAMHTAILSNLGNIKTNEVITPKIDGISMNINLTKVMPISIGMASAAGKARITFSSILKENDIIKDFFRFLADDGLDVNIQCNLRGDDRYVL